MRSALEGKLLRQLLFQLPGVADIDLYSGSRNANPAVCRNAVAAEESCLAVLRRKISQRDPLEQQKTATRWFPLPT